MNLFYQLPDDIIDKIYFECHKIKMNDVMYKLLEYDVKDGGWMYILSFNGFIPFNDRPTNSRLICCDYDKIYEEHGVLDDED